MDSPFRQYFGTNYTPSQEEERRIRDLVSGYNQEICNIDSDIARLRQQMNALYENRSTILEFANKHKELISPIRLLTQDILGYIFLACLPDHWNNTSFSIADAPMLLTHVCSSWRKLAMSIPRLWSRIHIALPSIRVDRFPIPDTLEEQVARINQILSVQHVAVNQWLDRSGECALSILVRQEISINGWRCGYETEAYGSAMKRILEAHLLLIKNTILKCPERWFSLDLFASDDIVHFLLEAGMNHEMSLPTLENIHVTRLVGTTSSGIGITPFQFKNILAILPSKTTSTTLYDIPLSFSVDSIPKNLRWTRLTEINVYFPNLSPANQYDAILAILGRCPQLITAKLMMDPRGDVNSTENRGSATVLQHLKHLSISLPSSPSALTSFAEHLYLPSIATLDLHFTHVFNHGWHQTPMITAAEILKSLVRVAEEFHTLRLFEPKWITSTEDFIQALRVVPSVKHLKIFSGHVQHSWHLNSITYADSNYTCLQPAFCDALLHTLNPKKKAYSDIICPDLEELECDRKWVTIFSESVLKDFLISRRDDPRVVPIRRLVVTINNYKRDDDRDSNEKVSLGDDSAIYFRREGVDSQYDFLLFSDIYTEL